jgi:transposase-like protein
LFRDVRDRGLRAPVLLMGDGGLPMWGAADQVWPETDHQRCWNHKIVNVLDVLPERVHSVATPLLTQIPYAETREKAENRRDQFVKRFGGEFPAAVETLERDWERMVTVLQLPEGGMEAPAHHEPGGEPVRLGSAAHRRWQALQASRRSRGPDLAGVAGG